MKTKAVRLYGKEDLRLEEFDLPEMKEDEILAHIISDSVCMSTYKAMEQGSDHKRVPKDIDRNPVIVGHEFCGEIVKVGSKWQHKFKPGQKFSIQPAMNYKGSLDAPGYSYRYIGGSATYVIIPNEVMETNCLLEYHNDAFFYGSVAEPMSCIVGTYHAMYHTKNGSYVHNMGIVEGGNMAILAGVGPMGIGAIDYAIHCDRKPGLLVVTDIDEARLKRAASIYTVEEAEKNGVRLVYVNTNTTPDAENYIMGLTGNKGFDDVMVFAPVRPVVEMGDRLLGKDGCLNFFAGPANSEFKAEFNFYNVHYASTHVVGTSGGNTQDMIESIEMMNKGLLNTASMITHIGGLNSVVDTVMNLPKIPGGKKLIYTNIDLPLTAIADFEKLGETDEMFKALDEICKRHNQLWNAEAEKYLLAHAKAI
ncbi:MAG: zinc-binding dehydrogenase [Clostridiales bacterium]|jgi:alcohol dehydrogenase, zinc-binding domain protein|nr:zinc-binding dehydrogenase [Clostridiales bacterium]PWM23037.1 MAG: L-sorbose 1-phosphate reductase [Clostridiales bacterium]